eukprot:CAMPEP_0202696000 /NCGR_PEP_ID=MMETSP1385-20130828/9398_1 /ASSEMBLY_ACC=CAM_ASM_000861 /TAXON_ID=933848 /ORGANISM="Elphidium margaritaceum" /LENGTH=621 /DNA_ID=CAMNT_0049352091 /DNA_START=46 /DNA_END=1912 /DNA_ORIENTATION=+
MNKLQASISRKKFMKFQIDQVDHRILVCGLESTGKSSIVNLIVNKEALQSSTPTLGVDMVPFETSSSKTVIFYEIGGNVTSRSLLNYYYDCDAIIYVVDSTKPESLQKKVEPTQQPQPQPPQSPPPPPPPQQHEHKQQALPQQLTPICTEQNVTNASRHTTSTPASTTFICHNDDDDDDSHDNELEQDSRGSDDSENDLFKADMFIDTAAPPQQLNAHDDDDDEEEEDIDVDSTPTMLRNFMSKFEKGTKSQPIPSYADITNLNEEESVEFGIAIPTTSTKAQNSSKLSKLLGVDDAANCSERTLNRSQSNPAMLLPQSVSSMVSTSDADSTSLSQRPRNIFVDTFRRRHKTRGADKSVQNRAKRTNSHQHYQNHSGASTSSFSSLSFSSLTSRTRLSTGSMMLTEKERRTYLKQQSVPILGHHSAGSFPPPPPPPSLPPPLLEETAGSLCLQPLTMKEAECHSVQELISKVNYELKSSDVPFLIYYNQQDASDALSKDEITRRLQYHRIINKTRQFQVVTCDANDEARVCQGFAWLLHTLKQIKLKQKEHRAMNELVSRLNAIDQDKYGPNAKTPQCVICDGHANIMESIAPFAVNGTANAINWRPCCIDDRATQSVKNA